MAKASNIISKRKRLEGLVPTGRRGAKEATFADGSTYDDLGNELDKDGYAWLDAPEQIRPGVAGEGTLQSIAIRVARAMKIMAKRGEKLCFDGQDGRKKIRVSIFPKGSKLPDEKGKVVATKQDSLYCVVE